MRESRQGTSRTDKGSWRRTRFQSNAIRPLVLASIFTVVLTLSLLSIIPPPLVSLAFNNIAEQYLAEFARCLASLADL